MPSLPRAFLFFSVGVCCYLAATLCAEQSQKVGNLTVHYSVINSTFLLPEVAKQYDIVRSDTRAVLSISVLDEIESPVAFPFKGTFKNLLGQVYPLNFKKIEEGEAIYYIANFRFVDTEQLKFNLEFDFAEGRETLTFTKKIYRQSR